MGDVASAVAWLRTQPAIDPNAIAVLGTGHGGWTAATAVQHRYADLRLSAAVDYHGLCTGPEEYSGVPFWRCSVRWTTGAIRRPFVAPMRRRYRMARRGRSPYIPRRVPFVRLSEHRPVVSRWSPREVRQGGRGGQLYPRASLSGAYDRGWRGIPNGTSTRSTWSCIPKDRLGPQFESTNRRPANDRNWRQGVIGHPTSEGPLFEPDRSFVMWS
jgi:hypothetical protein